MKKLLIAPFVFCFFTMIGFAQSIIQVNNLDEANADYTSLQEAVDAATAGSIIYLQPSGVSYGNAVVRKRISIIGPGFNLGANVVDDANVNLSNTIIGNIDFKKGSSNSFISGCDINDIDLDSITNIVIKRNWIRTGGISIINCNNIQINGNYFYDGTTDIYLNRYANGISITNNIFPRAGNAYAIYSETRDDNSALIRNNLFTHEGIYMANATITNNIFLDQSAAYSIYNSQISNNIFVGNHFSEGNKSNAILDDIFVGYPTIGGYSFDGRFQLKSDSPAKNYGTDGTDAGIFGGSEPYRPSGQSSIPYIYEIQAPTSAGTGGGLNVTIKARSSN